MIQLYYSYTDILLNVNTNNYIGQLSPMIKSRLSLLKRVEDQQLLLLSIILLSKALYQNGYDVFNLKDLQYSEAGRPYFKDSPFDFNISHTENCAAVVFSKDCRVGIDIEKIKEIDFSDFTNFFTMEQWEDINNAKDKYRKFYYYWTLIESGVKADGRGLSLITDKNIKLLKGELFIGNTKWFYNHFDFDPAISCCIVTGRKNTSQEIIKITSI